MVEARRQLPDTSRYVAVIDEVKRDDGCVLGEAEVMPSGFREAAIEVPVIVFDVLETVVGQLGVPFLFERLELARPDRQRAAVVVGWGASEVGRLLFAFWLGHR